MVIRHGTVDDAGLLAPFAERAFREAFGADNDAGDMNAYCASAFAPDVQRAHLGNPQMVTLLLFDDEGVLAAYAQLRPGAAVGPEHPAPIELWRFYVDKVHHGAGIAHRLMAAVVEAARQRGASTLWLGVWERNLRARAFYRKLGFADIGSHTFVLGSDRQTDRLMARDIRLGPSAGAGESAPE